MSAETNRLEEPFAADDKPARSEERSSGARPAEHDHGYEGRRAGYVVAVVANLVVLYVFHNLPRWGVSFITEDWGQILPYVDASIWGTMAANILWFFYDARWFRRLVQVGLNVLGFRVIWAMYTIFPFQFDLYPLEQAVRIAFLVAMVGLAIGTLVEIVSLMFGRYQD